MHKTKRFLVLALLASLTLGPSLLGGNLFTVHAKGKGASGSKDQKPNKVASELNAMLAANGVKIRRYFNNLNSFALELPSNVVDDLSNFPEVAFISLDSEVL